VGYRISARTNLAFQQLSALEMKPDENQT